jgi:ornithine--oxo-acid transaminase
MHRDRLAALDTLIDERLVDHAATVGAHLLRRLTSGREAT